MPQPPDTEPTFDDVPGHSPIESASVSGNDPATLEQRLAELEARHVEVSDAFLRAKAETENIRRRSEEEVAKARKFAIESFAESLLPVKDSLEAGLAIQNASIEQVHEGAHATLLSLIHI